MLGKCDLECNCCHERAAKGNQGETCSVNFASFQLVQYTVVPRTTDASHNGRCTQRTFGSSVTRLAQRTSLHTTDCVAVCPRASRTFWKRVSHNGLFA